MWLKNRKGRNGKVLVRNYAREVERPVRMSSCIYDEKRSEYVGWISEYYMKGIIFYCKVSNG